MKFKIEWFLLIIILLLSSIMLFNYESIDEEINVDSDTELYKINIDTSRLGNILSCYFYNIGLAFLHGKNFQTIIHEEGDMFTNYLPQKVEFDSSIQQAFISAGINDEILQKNLESFDNNCHSAWNIISKDLETFWNIMKPITNRLLKDALVKSGLDKPIDAPVIHFRCSDSPLNRLEYYHFQKYSFFKDSLEMIEKKTQKK